MLTVCTPKPQQKGPVKPPKTKCDICPKSVKGLCSFTEGFKEQCMGGAK